MRALPVEEEGMGWISGYRFWMIEFFTLLHILRACLVDLLLLRRIPVQRDAEDDRGRDGRVAVLLRSGGRWNNFLCEVIIIICGWIACACLGSLFNRFLTILGHDIVLCTKFGA